MTHREFCQKGGAAKSEAKICAVRRNLEKARDARKVRKNDRIVNKYTNRFV
jgi:hypothetical protein